MTNKAHYETTIMRKAEQEEAKKGLVVVVDIIGIIQVIQIRLWLCDHLLNRKSLLIFPIQEFINHIG
jgi:hypothetical protein